MPIDENSIPVIEQLARKVATRLATITSGNSYLIDVVEVVRPVRREDYTPKQGVCVMQMDTFEQGDPETDNLGVKLHRTVGLTIDYFIEPTDASTAAYDSLQAFAICEIERALAADFYPDGEAAYDGLGHNARLGAPQFLRDANNASAGVRVNLFIDYRHSDLNPYEAL